MLRCCTQCNEEKDIEKFVNQNGKYRNKCKECKNKSRRTGKPHHYFPKGNVPWNKGLKERTSKTRIYTSLSDEIKLKISISKKGKPTSKEKIENIKSKWRAKKVDFSRRSEIYKDWRKAVLERDGNKCTECGAKDNLHVHHKLPYNVYPEKRIEVDNGITLCRFCHLSLEHKGKYVSQETCKKISLVKKGKTSTFIHHKHTEESKKKMSDAKKGKPCIAWIGRKHSEETKRKISLAKTGIKTGTSGMKGKIPWNKGLKKVK